MQVVWQDKALVGRHDRYPYLDLNPDRDTMPTGYKVRALAQKRRLPANLMRSILQVLEEARQSMSDAELLARLGRRYRRFDPEFQRQVRLNLRDGVSYGILRRSKDQVSLRTQRLGELMAALEP